MILIKIAKISLNLSYQIGLTNLLLKWKEEEKQVKSVITLSEKYKWNNLGNLYQEFYNNYGIYPIK